MGHLPGRGFTYTLAFPLARRAARGIGRSRRLSSRAIHALKGKQGSTRRDGDELLSAAHDRDGTGIDGSAKVRAPSLATVPRIEREEHAISADKRAAAPIHWRRVNRLPRESDVAGVALTTSRRPKSSPPQGRECCTFTRQTARDTPPELKS